jgi:hypothetical protein
VSKLQPALPGYLARSTTCPRLGTINCLTVRSAGEKEDFFAAIAARLKPAAPLVSAELFLPANEATTPALLAHWATLAGLDAEEASSMTERMARLFFPVGSVRFVELVGRAGFTSPQPFFEALQFRGSLMRKA